MKEFRGNGAIGALLDEYEKSILELIAVIKEVSDEELMKTVDGKTKDPDCVSIQSILNHVIGSGYNYVIVIRKHLGERIEYLKPFHFDSVAEFEKEILKMFQFNEKLFEDHPNVKIEEYDPEKKILVRWGQLYDIEQLFEHAILHILRHRRQIEKFILSARLRDHF